MKINHLSTEIRNSTPNNNVIFWDGKELPTRKSGAINSKGGILLEALIPELNQWVEHRSNDNHGYKGFSFGDDKRLPSQIRSRLEYKY
jgi:hypothetical protein